MSGTWLYVKQHNQTGLMYFGKTVRNPLKYKGSGSYWSSHRQIHGNDISTLWYEYVEDEDLLVESAELNERGQKIIPYNDYLIDPDVYEEIVMRHLKDLKIPKWRKEATSRGILLGCSPKFKKPPK